MTSSPSFAYQLFWVALFGSLGCTARYLAQLGFQTYFPNHSYYAIFGVNVLGSLTIGLLGTALYGTFVIPETIKLGILTGFLGGFTTFSAFSFIAIELFIEEKWGHFLSFVLGNTVFGILAAALGIWTAKVLFLKN